MPKRSAAQAPRVPPEPVFELTPFGARATFPDQVVIESRHAALDRHGRLWVELTAHMGDAVVNQARIDLLDQKDRMNFHSVAFARDGRVDWQSLLLSTLPYLQKQIEAPTAAAAPVLDTYTARELMTRQLPDPRWAVPDLLLEGLSIFAGRPKLGKSWLVLSLGLAIAAGGRALGRIPVTPGSVLYAALEDTPRRMQGRIRALLASGEPPPQALELLHQAPRIDQDLIEALDRWCELHTDARLIVVDTLAKIRAPRRRDSDWYADDMAFGASLQALAVRHGVALLVVHHLNRSGAADPLDQVNGTTGLAGSADGVLILQRSRGQADATLMVTGRDVEEQSLALQFDKGAWSLLGKAAEYQRTREQQAIVTALREADRPMTPKEIAFALQKPGEAVRFLLGKLVDQGAIRSPSRGVYTVPSTPREPGEEG